MKKIIIASTLMVLACSVFALQNAEELFVPSKHAEQGTPITIEEAVQIALDNNTTIKDAVKNRDIYRAQVKEFRSYMFPTLSVSGTYTYNNERQAAFFNGAKMEMGSDNSLAVGADANWVLWSGGKIRSGYTIAKKTEASAEFSLQSVRDQIEKEVTSMCYAIILSNAVARVQQGHLDIANQTLKEMKLKYDQGLSSNLDLLSQEVTVANIEPLVIQAHNTFEVGNLQLKKLLNKDPEDEVYLAWDVAMDVPEVKDLAQLYDLAAESRPDLRAAALRVEITKKDITLARSEHFPQLIAFANKYYNGQSDGVWPDNTENYWSSAFGLKMNFPLFEGFRVNSVVQQKKLAYEQAQQDYDYMKREVRISIKSAWLNFGEAKKRMASGDTVIKQSKQNLDSMTKRYRAGLASRLELDDAVVALTNAQLQYVQAVHDAFNALADLRFSVGYEVKI
ncbi:outer membrane protein TolC [Elusimicrobium simillimum]|uniref:TolC family protein n=1 Tax=Elusimicrobium simillimum TaxID=3143438 RepID=UPI003C6F1AA6